MLDTMLTLEVIIAILLSVVILMQNKNVALNLSSMSGGAGANTKRGPEKILHNATIFLAILFIVNSTLLFVIQSDGGTKTTSSTTKNIDLNNLKVEQVTTTNSGATIEIKKDIKEENIELSGSLDTNTDNL